MSVPWLRSRRIGSWRVNRDGPIGVGRAASIVIVIVASVATVLLYRAAGHGSGRNRELVVQSVPLSTAASGSLFEATTSPSGAIPATPSQTPPTVATPAPFGNDALRPGVDLVARVDLSLDGSRTGQVAVTSRYTVAGGCQPLYADIYSLVDGSWKPVFSATDPSLPYGPILTPPEQTANGCFPKIRLFAPQPGSGGNDALLLIGAGYADGSARLTILGWDAVTPSPAVVFDWHTGAYGSIARSTDGDRVEIGEDAPLPAAIAALGVRGTAGRLLQSIAFDAGAPHVVERRIAPPCQSGRISAGTTRGIAVPNTGRLLVLGCASGLGVSAAPETASLNPPGITWADLRDGDSVEVEYDADSLELVDGTPALPELASLSDEAALARHQPGQRPAQPAPQRSAPAAPVQRPSAPASAPRQPQAPPAAAPRQSEPSQPASAPRSSGASSNPPAVPSVRAAPAPVTAPPPAPPQPAVTAPPPPRAPPFVAPPRAPNLRGG